MKGGGVFVTIAPVTIYVYSTPGGVKLQRVHRKLDDIRSEKMLVESGRYH